MSESIPDVCEQLIRRFSSEGSTPAEWEDCSSSEKSRVFRNSDYVVKIEPCGASFLPKFLGRLFSSSFERVRYRESRIQAAGLTMPEVICTGSQGELAFIVYRRAYGAPLLKALNGIEKTERQMILGNLAKEIAKLHNAGICHGDLNPTNILYEAQNARFVLLDGGQSRKWLIRLPDSRAIRDLSQLNFFHDFKAVTLFSRYRFLRQYLSSRKFTYTVCLHWFERLKTLYLERLSRKKSRAINEQSI